MKIGDASVLSVTQAREKAKDLLAQATLGANIDKRARRKENPLLSDIVEEYKKVWAPLHSGRQQALERMTVNFNEFMDLPISELRLIDIETWRVNLLEKNKASDEFQHETDISSVPQQRTNTNDARQLIRHTQKAIKRNTINRYMSQLQAMLNWAAEREIIPSNPIAGLKNYAKQILLRLQDISRMMRGNAFMTRWMLERKNCAPQDGAHVCTKTDVICLTWIKFTLQTI